VLPILFERGLQAAAVIGKTFSEALLGRVVASVATIDETALSSVLAALAAAVLYELFRFRFVSRRRGPVA
jgi:flagellar biosynthesis/type III secretory pathway ATPase